MNSHTVTGLKRWSCQDSELPSVQQVKAIHIYDFDNTLFKSPLPNVQIWNGPTLGFLQNADTLVNGGWWQDANILASTGEGVAKEESRAWDGWWNEQIVRLVELSMQQKDALTVLLTGRSESGFADLIKRMVASKRLEFDMVCLKPAVGPANQRFDSTMIFKQALLADIVYTYRDADEIRVYEDRVKHVKAFRDYFTTFNKALHSPDPPVARKPITAEVIQVSEAATTLDAVTEVAEVQKMINFHNQTLSAPLNRQQQQQIPNNIRARRCLQIKRTVFYTGYIIPPATTSLLLTLMSTPPHLPEGEIKFLANNILITPRPCPASILEKTGDIGTPVKWQVTGVASFESKVWAASVAPVPATQKFYTENKVPMVVLGLRRGAKPIEAGRIQNWQPVPPEKAFVFDTVVGEKVLLRIEERNSSESEWESLFPSRGLNRNSHPQEKGNHNNNNNNNNKHNNNRDAAHPNLGHPYPPHNHNRNSNPNPNPHPSSNNNDNHPPNQNQNRRGAPYRGGNPNRGRGRYNANANANANNSNNDSNTHNERGGGGGGGGGGRGGRGGRGGGGRGGRGEGRGRGGRGGGGGGGAGYGGYRSLDDVGERGYGGYGGGGGGGYGYDGSSGGGGGPSYDDGIGGGY